MRAAPCLQRAGQTGRGGTARATFVLRQAQDEGTGGRGLSAIVVHAARVLLVSGRGSISRSPGAELVEALGPDSLYPVWPGACRNIVDRTHFQYHWSTG